MNHLIPKEPTELVPWVFYSMIQFLNLFALQSRR